MYEGWIAHIDGCCLAARYTTKDLELEASDWEAEIKRLQSLLSVENTRNSLKSQELPRLDQQIRSNESSLPELASLKDAV